MQLMKARGTVHAQDGGELGHESIARAGNERGTRGGEQKQRDSHAGERSPRPAPVEQPQRAERDEQLRFEQQQARDETGDEGSAPLPQSEAKREQSETEETVLPEADRSEHRIEAERPQQPGTPILDAERPR